MKPYKTTGNIRIAIETDEAKTKIPCTVAVRILDEAGETLCRVEEKKGIVDFPLDPDRPDVNGPVRGKRSPVEIVKATEKFIKLHRLSDDAYFKEQYRYEQPDMGNFPFDRFE